MVDANISIQKSDSFMTSKQSGQQSGLAVSKRIREIGKLKLNETNISFAKLKPNVSDTPFTKTAKFKYMGSSAGFGSIKN